MLKHFKIFNEHSDYLDFKQNDDFLKPNLSYCDLEDDVHFYHDYPYQYLTFTALENGTITYNIYKDMGTNYIKSVSYSLDDGKTWNTTYNQDNKSGNLQITVNVNTEQNVLWKADMIQNTYYYEYMYYNSYFSATCNFDAKGNIMSLLYGDNFIIQKDLSNTEYTFMRLFQNCNKLKSAKNLILPATTLTNDCYNQMFDHCSGLTIAPELPATTLTDSCYSGMFHGCTSLIAAPELPATTLNSYCYTGMFNTCTSLTTAPELPATTLTRDCYQMMFQNCTSLTTAPVLPATTLSQGCYGYMFDGCRSLNYIKAMFLTEPSSSSTRTSNWVRNVAASGTFVKNSAAEWDLTGSSGIPSGWTVETASE